MIIPNAPPVSSAETQKPSGTDRAKGLDAATVEALIVAAIAGVVVLALLKNALGLQQVPPPIVTNGLALVLTWYVMYPVGMEIAGNLQQTHGAAGLRSAAVTDVIKAADAPMRNFLRKHR